MSGENDGSVAASRKLDTLGLSSVADNKSFKVAERAGRRAGCTSKKFRPGERSRGGNGEWRRGEKRRGKGEERTHSLHPALLTSVNLRKSHGTYTINGRLLKT